MKNCPKVGARVSFAGNSVVGPCVGTVKAIYPQYGWDEDRQRDTALLPERMWHVSMEPDVLPDPWCYVESLRFAPEVRDLRKAAP